MNQTQQMRQYDLNRPRTAALIPPNYKDDN